MLSAKTLLTLARDEITQLREEGCETGVLEELLATRLLNSGRLALLTQSLLSDADVDPAVEVFAPVPLPARAERETA